MSGRGRDVWAVKDQSVLLSAYSHNNLQLRNILQSFLATKTHVVSMSSKLALWFETLDKLIVWHWGFWYCWTFWMFYFPSGPPCSSVMTDFLWSCPARKHVAKIKLGCVLWMILSCLRVCEQVFLMGLLWSVQFLLEVSPSVFLCASQYASSSLSLPSCHPKENMKKVHRRFLWQFFELNVLCTLYDAIQKWVAALGYSLSYVALSLTSEGLLDNASLTSTVQSCQNF